MTIESIVVINFRAIPYLALCQISRVWLKVIFPLLKFRYRKLKMKWHVEQR